MKYKVPNQQQLENRAVKGGITSGKNDSQKNILPLSLIGKRRRPLKSKTYINKALDERVGRQTEMEVEAVG